MRKNTGGATVEEDPAGVNPTCTDGIGASDEGPAVVVDPVAGDLFCVPSVVVVTSDRERFPAISLEGRRTSVESNARFCCTAYPAGLILS